MHTSPDTEQGHELLARISSAIVSAQKEYWGKGPERAKSYLLDDFLLIVMRGGLTRAEQTMLDIGEVDRCATFARRFRTELPPGISAGSRI